MHTTAAASAAAASAHSDRVIIAVQAADVRALAVIGLEDHFLRKPSEKKRKTYTLKKKPQEPKNPPTISAIHARATERTNTKIGGG